MPFFLELFQLVLKAINVSLERAHQSVSKVLAADQNDVDVPSARRTLEVEASSAMYIVKSFRSVSGRVRHNKTRDIPGDALQPSPKALHSVHPQVVRSILALDAHSLPPFLESKFEVTAIVTTRPRSASTQ